MVRFTEVVVGVGGAPGFDRAWPGRPGLGPAGGPAQEPNRPVPPQQQPAPGEPQGNTPQDLIRSNLQQQPASGFIRLGEVSIPFTGILANFYANRDYRPAWTDPRAVEELIRAIKDSQADGLSPEDYHLQAIASLLPPGKGQATPELTAARDLLMTDALLRLGYHLRFGKIDPQSLFPDISLKQTGPDADIIKTGQQAIDTVQITGLARDLEAPKPLLCGPQESPGRPPGHCRQGWLARHPARADTQERQQGPPPAGPAAAPGHDGGS